MSTHYSSVAEAKTRFNGTVVGARETGMASILLVGMKRNVEIVSKRFYIPRLNCPAARTISSSLAMLVATFLAIPLCKSSLNLGP